MPTPLTNLTDDATLLLYAAGELSPAGRAAVDRALAGDAGLRARLDDLRALAEATDAALAAGDGAAAAGPLAVERVAARASAAVRAWQTNRRAPAREPRVAAGWWRRLAVTAAAAAAVVALLAGGIAVRNLSGPRPGPLANGPSDGPSDALPPVAGPADVPAEQSPEGQLAVALADAMAAGDGEEQLLPPVSLPPVSLPPVSPSAAWPSNPGEAVASADAAAADGPYFDVPLDLPLAGGDGPTAPVDRTNEPVPHRPL